MISRICLCCYASLAAPSQRAVKHVRKFLCSASDLNGAPQVLGAQKGETGTWRVTLHLGNDVGVEAARKEGIDTTCDVATAADPFPHSQAPGSPILQRGYSDRGAASLHGFPHGALQAIASASTTLPPWSHFNRPWLRPYTYPREAACLDRRASFASRFLGTLRRGRGGGDGDVESYYGNSGTNGGRGADASVRSRRQQNGPRRVRAEEANQAAPAVPARARNDGAGGSHRRTQRDNPETRGGRGAVVAATEAEAGSSGRGPRHRAAGAEAAGAAGSSGPPVLLQLIRAGSWVELQRLLDLAAQHGPLAHWNVSAAVQTYCKLVNGAALVPTPEGEGARAAAPQAAAPAAAPPGLEGPGRDGARLGGHGAALVEPPPPGLRERLQADLLSSVPSLTFSELSHCMKGLAALPRPYSLLTNVGYGNSAAALGPGERLGAVLSDALLFRLEEHLLAVAVGLQKREQVGGLAGKSTEGNGRRRGPRAGADRGGGERGSGGDVGAGVESDEERRRVARLITFSCTAVRRLGITRPSVYRALAAAATPMLGTELVGEALPPLVIGFLEAGNPEPLFMEQLVYQSSQPYSLAQTSSIFANTLLLRAAGLTGAERAVVDPLATRLAEVLREWLGKRSHMEAKREQLAQQQQQPASSQDLQQQPASSQDLQQQPASSQDLQQQQPGSSQDLQQQQQQQQRAAGSRPSEDDLQLTYVLEACDVAGLGPDCELVQVLVEETKRRQSRWDLLHRLMLAWRLSALGYNVVAPVTSSPLAPLATAAEAAEVGPGPITGHRQRAPQSEPHWHQHQQQQQGPPPVDWVLIREEEVLEYLRQGNITRKALLPLLNGLARMRMRRTDRAIRGAAAEAAADEVDANPVAGGGDSADLAAAAAARNPNSMPTALGVAVQLTDAAAAAMAPRQVASAMAALAVAGIAMPSSLLQRAEQLYYRQQQTAPAGRGGSIVGSSGADASDATMVDGRGGQNGVEQNVAKATVAAATCPAGADGASPLPDDVASREVRQIDGGGVHGGGGSGGVTSLCAMVGRVLAWQPSAAATAMLSDDFVRHCRNVALGACRGGR